jgi:putative SbcD/Mre11-related phosphoesterase
MHQLDDDICITNLCLYLTSIDTLVIGDAHLGYEESLTKQGVLIPKFQFEEILATVKAALDDAKPSTTIVVGDLKHEFGRISSEEWRDTLTFIDAILDKSELILLEGNHDTMLEPIAEKRDLDVQTTTTKGGYFFCHGHTVPDTLDMHEPHTIVMGHEHPAVGLRDGQRVEYYKCFLDGTYGEKRLLILPSLSSLPEGTDVTQERLQSPLIDDIDAFTAVVAGEELYEFHIGELIRTQP